jgi:hypothetical protein
MEGLGRLFDLACGVAPVDLAGGAQTGIRVHLKNCAGVTVVFFKEAGAASEATTLDLQEHSASTGGTSQDLDEVDHYYLKSEATLDNDETWTRVTQTRASEITPAASDTQQILAFYVDATWLSDGFEWISVNTTDTTTAGQLGSVLYILHDLAVQRRPDNLAELLT